MKKLFRCLGQKWIDFLIHKSIYAKSERVALWAMTKLYKKMKPAEEE